MRVLVATPAQQELARAIQFYDDQAAGLAKDFVDEIDAAIQQIAELPRSGAPHRHGTRRIVLRRFPFAVIYRVETEVVEVVAIAHERRRPDYWL